MMTDITAVILAGGKSRRMGADKSLLVVDGQPMLARVIQALRPLNLPMVLVTNTPDIHGSFLLPMMTDLQSGFGALGGVYTALSQMSTEYALVVACDMPRLNTTVLAYLVTLTAHYPDAAAIVPRIAGRAQPLHAVYHKRCLSILESHLNTGNLALNAFLEHVPVHWVDEADLRPFDLTLSSFLNLNTPQDLIDLPPLSA